ncbi:MAG: hypothetical protein PHF95_06670 [bacterium]|nr:hypothetical protein [bacterium]
MKDVRGMLFLLHEHTFEFSIALEKYIDSLNLLKPRDLSLEDSQLWDNVNDEVKEYFGRLKYDYIGFSPNNEEFKKIMKENIESYKRHLDNDRRPEATLSRSLMYRWHQKNKGNQSLD